MTQRRSMAVNRSMTRSMIDQLPMAAVVVNCPPFRGALTACHPHRLINRGCAMPMRLGRTAHHCTGPVTRLQGNNWLIRHRARRPSTCILASPVGVASL